MRFDAYLLNPFMPWLLAAQMPLAFWHGVTQQAASAAADATNVVAFPRRRPRPLVDFGEKRMSGELIRFDFVAHIAGGR